MMTFQLLNTEKFDEFIRSKGTSGTGKLLYSTPKTKLDVKYLDQTVIPFDTIEYTSFFLSKHLNVECDVYENDACHFIFTNQSDRVYGKVCLEENVIIYWNSEFVRDRQLFEMIMKHINKLVSL